MRGKKIPMVDTDTDIHTQDHKQHLLWLTWLNPFHLLFIICVSVKVLPFHTVDVWF